MTLISIAFEIVSLTDSNTGLALAADTLQASVENTIAVKAKDQYGNDIKGTSFGLVFSLELNDGTNTFTSTSSYDIIDARYELKVTPTLAVTSATLKVTYGGADISGSPKTVAIVAGPCKKDSFQLL